MQKDERDLLGVLKDELAFLEGGGYARSPGTAWRPIFIFEDSPSCMNHGHRNDPASCSDCVLMQFVPLELRSAPIPCRHIRLNAVGETLDSLYRYGDEHEIEETVVQWLQATISPLEEERRAFGGAEGKPALQEGNAMKGAALFQNVRPKCANPACAAEFQWVGGGKFFRFRSDPAATNENKLAAGSSDHLSHVKHFWLCQRCSGIFTLVEEKDSGVVLRLLGIELAIDEAKKVWKAVS
ncbi:MAG: hypothetical protein WBD73_07860 [Candidatus Acidiferrales bacterium]